MEPLDHLYFNWLVAKVLVVQNPTPSNQYDKLFRVLHNTEYVWLVSGDDNRAEDGVELRDEFLTASGLSAPYGWLEQPCSLFEMLIAFARRAEFMTDVAAPEWFWEFMDNLGLREFTDACEETSDEIAEILYEFVWRQYDCSGRGGLFPLHDPPEDQKRVEIWYQFCEYLTDQHRMP